jgi:hypothetical protein
MTPNPEVACISHTAVQSSSVSGSPLALLALRRTPHRRTRCHRLNFRMSLSASLSLAAPIAEW